MTKLAKIAFAAAVALAAAPALAQTGHGGHGTHAAPADQPAGVRQMMDMLKSSAESPSTRAFEEANARMHRDMDIAFSGDADVDFIRGMIPHHQGAVDMARILLEHGKDPELRRLADEIVEAQEKEIAMMKAWLEKNAPAPVEGETMPGMGH